MLPTIFRTTRMPIIFNELMGNSLWNDRLDYVSASSPAVNIIENEKEYRIELAAPGLSKEDMKIDLHDNLLTLSSEREDVKENNSEDFVKKEFSYSSFKKCFTIPDTVNADKISAEYRNGVLDVHIPKKAAAVQKAPKQISIS